MRRLQSRIRLIGLQLLLFFPMCFCVVSSLYAMDITLKWVPNNDSNLAGYKVFYREEDQSYNYNTPYWECTEPECTIYDLDVTKTYYFVVRAFDSNGNTSDSSNEVELHEGVAINSTGSSGGGGGGGCFIATAAYGSPLEPHVRLLCQFRDRFLLTNGPGKIFVKYYYKYSPPAANIISKNDVLRAVVCIFLLPLEGFSWMLLKVGPGFTLLITLLIGIGLIYFVRWKKNAVLLR
jgi:hypothetical protein